MTSALSRFFGCTMLAVVLALVLALVIPSEDSATHEPAPGAAR